MRVPIGLLALSTCVGVMLAGCADTQQGSAQPADRPTSTSNGGATRTPSRSSTPSAADSPLGTVDPCALLSDADRAQLGLDDGKPGRIGQSKMCDWDAERWGLTVGVEASLSFQDADLRGATPSPVDIGRHEAHRVENSGGGEGGCEVFIVTGKTSFVHVITGTSSGSDTPYACDRAIAVAKAVDPKLP